MTTSKDQAEFNRLTAKGSNLTAKEKARIRELVGKEKAAKKKRR